MTLHPAALRLAATGFLLASFAAAPAFAADATASGTGATPPAKHMMHSPEDMKQHVEARIKDLHAKLKITPDEEAAWNDVATAMRDSENNVSDLIKDRHQNATTMTAVDDMQSYQKITQAHADGLGKVIAAFTKLYDMMPDDQKKNADKVFGSFEGHEHGMHSTKAESK